MSKRVLKLTIAYDGKAYQGWQTSIAPHIRKILEGILQEPVILDGASRTDAGVHAHGQVAHCIFHNSLINADRLKHSANRLLPKDIVILTAEEVQEKTNSISKEYHYTLSLAPFQLPNERFYAWHCPQPLDLNAMRQAATAFIGKQNFAALCNAKVNEAYADYVREIFRLDLIPSEGQLRIEIEGSHFLYKMVRNIVGTLVAVGRGNISPTSIPLILHSRNRIHASVTAPAHGLTLLRVSF